MDFTIRNGLNTVFAQCIDALPTLGSITHSHEILAMM